MTMILRSSPPSPFGRKVEIGAHLLGLMDQIDVQATNTNDANDPIRQQNPLGKIPTLVLEDGKALYDSRVILEYLNDRATNGVSILPAEGAMRWQALTLQALADGMMEAGVLQVYERRFRPNRTRSAVWTSYQADKVTRALAYLEANTPALGSTPTVGDISLACALGYLDFRFDGAWRADHPTLVGYLDRFSAAVPALAETAPPAA